jgi:hypothetical protein
MEKETKLGPLARRRPHRMQAEPHHFSRPAHGATVRRPDPSSPTCVRPSNTEPCTWGLLLLLCITWPSFSVLSGKTVHVVLSEGKTSIARSAI